MSTILDSNRYISPYIIEEVIFTNIIKLRVLTSMRNYLIMNVS